MKLEHRRTTLRLRAPLRSAHGTLTERELLSVTITGAFMSLFFWIGYGAANKFLDPLILQLRKLTANEAVPSCVFSLIMLYAISAEWLGSVA